MIAVLTGDVINSRKAPNIGKVISNLEKALSYYKGNQNESEIYRGDSFQMEMTNIEEALTAAIHIKARVKLIKEVDIRIGIGIGKRNHSDESVRKSYGEAYINSGETFDLLREKKRSLGIKTPLEEVNTNLELAIKLGAIVMDNWLSSSAKMIVAHYEYGGRTQKELGELLNVTQSTISTRQSRAYLSEILELDKFYRSKVEKLKTL